MDKSLRFAKWDNIKLFLILCVVLGHLAMRFDAQNVEAKRLLLFIYSFHMPAFVFISGLFSKNIVNNKRYSAVGSMLILFLVTKFGYFLSRVLAGYKPRFLLRITDDISWYALAIAVFYIITIWIKDYSHLYIIIFSVVVACFVGCAKDIGLYLSLSRMFTFFPFFFAGYIVDREAVERIINDRKFKIIAAILIVVLIAIIYFTIDDSYWLMGILRGKKPYRRLHHEGELEFIYRALWYPISGCIMLAVFSLIPSKRLVISKFGSRTMAVYALHYIPMQFFFVVLGGREWISELPIDYFGIKLLILLGIAIIITGLLSLKPVDFIMRKIIYPPKQG